MKDFRIQSYLRQHTLSSIDLSSAESSSDLDEREGIVNAYPSPVSDYSTGLDGEEFDIERTLSSKEVESSRVGCVETLWIHHEMGVCEIKEKIEQRWP